MGCLQSTPETSKDHAHAPVKEATQAPTEQVGDKQQPAPAVAHTPPPPNGEPAAAPRLPSLVTTTAPRVDSLSDLRHDGSSSKGSRGSTGAPTTPVASTTPNSRTPRSSEHFQPSPLYHGPLPTGHASPTPPSIPPGSHGVNASFNKRRLIPSRNSSRSSILSRELSPRGEPPPTVDTEPSSVGKDRDSGGALEAAPSCVSVTHRTSSGLLFERTSRLSSGSLLRTKFARGDSLTCLPDNESKRRASLTFLSPDQSAVSKEFLKAARAGIVEMLQAMLDLATNQEELVNCVDNEYETALHKAALMGHEHVAAFLLASNASALEQNKDGFTPIMVAAANGHRKVCFLLASNGGAAKALPPRVKYTIGNAHTEQITTIELSSDGRRMLTASRDETVRLWHSADAQQIALVGKHKAGASSCAFMQHAPGAVSCCVDKTLTLWDLYELSPAEVKAQLPGAQPRVPLPISLSIIAHEESILALALAPAGGLLTASADKTIKCWDIRGPVQSRSDVKLVHTLRGHGGPVRAVAITKDSQTAVSGGDDKQVRLWDLRYGQCAHTMDGHTAPITCCTFTPDGRRALSGAEDGGIIVWDVRSGLPRWQLTGHHKGAVTKILVSADSAVAYSVSLDMTLRMWDLAGGAQLVSLRGHRLPLTAMGLSPDGQMLVMGSEQILKAIQLQWMPGLQPWQAPAATHLAMAVQQGNPRLTLMLLCAGADPSPAPGGWLGLLALAASHPDVAELLQWWCDALAAAEEEIARKEADAAAAEAELSSPRAA